MAGIALIERDEELALFRRLTAGILAGRTAVVEITGAPGIGRSSLVGAAMTLAEQAGVKVLYARGSQAEAGLRGGVVGQLLAGLVPDAAVPAAEPATSPAALCQTFLSAGREAPLMLVLDDAHWADAYSWQFLLSLLCRVGDAALLVVFAGGQLRQERSAVVADVRERALDGRVGWHRLQPSPLSADGVRRLLAEAGRTDPQDAFVAYVMRMTCGLPTLFRSATDALRRGELIAAVEHQAAFEVCLRRDVFDWADQMITELSPDQLALLRAIVVCGDDLDWELVVSLARVRGASASRMVEELARHGVLLGGCPPRLLCPFTRERVLAQMTRAEREELFARAAELGYRAAIGASELARLLLSAPPSGQPWAVRVLWDEAARADAEGQSEAGARLLARALQEPVQEADRARLQTELASVEVLHAPEQSDRRLVRVLERQDWESGGLVRIHAADLLLSRGNTEEFQRAVTEALTSPSMPTDDRAALEGLYWLAIEAPHDAPAPVLPAPSLREQPAGCAQSAAVAWQLLVRGRDLARTRALARVALGAGKNAPLTPRIIASRILVLCDDVAEAEAGLDAALVDAGRLRARSVCAWARLIRANLNLRNGHLDEAADDLDRALAVLPLRCWHPMAQPGVRAVQMALHLETGRLDRVEELVAVELPPGVESSLGWSQFLQTKGVFRLLAGDPQGAAEDLREVGRRLLARQWVNPALAAWRSFAALALQASGQDADAERLVGEERALAARWGAPSALGGAHLAASMVLDGPARLGSLIAAVEVLRGAPSRLRYAKALLLWSVARREAGEVGEATRLATEAGELAWANGARDLADQARVLGWDPLGTLPAR